MIAISTTQPSYLTKIQIHNQVDHGAQTPRGLSHLAQDSETEDLGSLINDFDNKTTVDVGSGYGSLACDIYAKKYESQVGESTKVISINPAFMKPAFRQENFPRMLEDYPIVRDSQHKDNVIEEVINNSIAADWCKLPLADRSVYQYISQYAFPLHCPKDSEFAQGLKEIDRVLKPGGKLKLTGITRPYNSSLIETRLRDLSKYKWRTEAKQDEHNGRHGYLFMQKTAN